MLSRPWQLHWILQLFTCFKITKSSWSHSKINEKHNLIFSIFKHSCSRLSKIIQNLKSINTYPISCRFLIIQNIAIPFVMFSKIFWISAYKTFALSHSKYVLFHLCIIFSFFHVNRITREFPVPLGSVDGEFSEAHKKQRSLKNKEVNLNLLVRLRVMTH